MVPTLYAVSYAVATLLSLAVTWRGYQARPRQGAGWFTISMVGVTWWSFMWFLQILVFERDGVRMLFNAFHWIGVGIVSVGVFGFGLAMSGRGEKLTRTRILVLSVVPAVGTLARFGHGHVRGLLRPVPERLDPLLGMLATLSGTWGWLEWVVLLYLYGLIALGSLFLAETAIGGQKRDPARLLLGVMIAVPWTVNVLYELGIFFTSNVDPTVFGFLVTGIVGIAVVDRFRLFDVPFVRSQLIEQLSTPVLVYGGDGRVYDYNQQAGKLLGLKPIHIDEHIREVLVSTPLSVPEAVDTDEESLSAALDSARVSIEIKGETRYFLIQMTELVSVTDRNLGYALQFVDVTEQHRRRETLRRQNERLDEFAGLISHDLRNPLNVAQLRLDLARQDHDSEDLAAVGDALDRMGVLIEDLLMLARYGQSVEETEQIQLSTIANHSWEMVETDSADIQITGDQTLDADPDRLGELFENLFRNSIEHAAPGDSTDAMAVAIEVGTLSERDGFYVADDGPGIPDDERDSIFESGYTTEDDGSGLGLAIVSEIVDAHDWQIRVTDHTTGGARFEIETTSEYTDRRTDRLPSS